MSKIKKKQDRLKWAFEHTIDRITDTIDKDRQTIEEQKQAVEQAEQERARAILEAEGQELRTKHAAYQLIEQKEKEIEELEAEKAGLIKEYNEFLDTLN